ncbi:class I SAM-dependent methyltransferase [Sagittula stellata]|nr:class I SAM-dependent methyltransferase [Sagittula stellata]
MSDWSNGYPTDSVYIDAIQPAISPWRWHQSLAFAGRDAPDPGKPFRFLELGCGSATTLIGLAAAYPWAEFTGYDFMPECVMQANALIAETGMTNVEVREASFAEMAQETPAEKYDFASAHGVWTWVPETVRRDIVAVMGRWLAPGAVFYVGYNTAAGWAASEPIRKIFAEVPKGPPGNPYGPAREAVSHWLTLMGETNPGVRAHWATMADRDDHFLAHELGNPHGTGVWMEEVAAPLADAKMAYGGPAVLAENMDGPFLDEPRLDLLRQAVAEGWGEAARDLLHGRFFRKDLYHRGAPFLGASEMVARMRALDVVPWDQEIRLTTHLGIYRRLKHHLQDDLVAALHARAAEGATLGDCADVLGDNPAQTFQIAMLALASGKLLDRRPAEQIAASEEGCDRFNMAMLRRLQTGAPSPGLVSPVIGGAIEVQEETHRTALAEGEPGPDLARRLRMLGVA